MENDKTKSVEAGDQIEKLEWIQDRMRDDFAANQALRQIFRVNYVESFKAVFTMLSKRAIIF